ncbi:MAG: hypothetical protein EOM08_09630 [Clostridia bacterium]|nr:hypothetical protein [Clostridia bacterium]
MLYLLALGLAILAGVVRSRQINALMLWELRAVFLLPLALFTALLPYWLGTYWPSLIWTEDRRLLMVLQLLARSLFLSFVLINLVRTARRTNWTDLRRFLQVAYLRLLQRIQARPHRIPAGLARRSKQVRDLSPLRLAGLFLAVPGLIGQMMVLWTNQGYWPLPVSYLDQIEDPLLAEGIRNGALHLSRLMDDQTRYAFLGRMIAWPDWAGQPATPSSYVSLTDLALALALFLVTISLFPARKKIHHAKPDSNKK